MEGFKSNPKMRSDIACYKEGGSVGYKSRHSEKTEMKEDVAQDKAMIKKGVAQHEAAKHKGEAKTELKLKAGGRCKKEGGSIRKYKAGSSCYKEGGEVKKPKADGAIGMKKDAEDKKAIAKIKAKGSAPKKKEPKTIQKFEDGGNVLTKLGKRLKDNLMGTPEQNAEAQKNLDRIAKQPGAMGDVERAIRGMGQATPQQNLGQAAPMGALSDKEQELMNGIRAVGRAMGGKV